MPCEAGEACEAGEVCEAGPHGASAMWHFANGEHSPMTALEGEEGTLSSTAPECIEPQHVPNFASQGDRIAGLLLVYALL